MFGKVGRGAARFLYEAGVTVIGVSDQYGGVWSPSGLDLPALEDQIDATGSVIGFPGAVPIENDELHTLDVCSCRRRRRRHPRHSATDIKAGVAVEGANGPTTTNAARVLEERGILVLPDILANAGGVVVAYFEWPQANQAYWCSEAEVEVRLATDGGDGGPSPVRVRAAGPSPARSRDLPGRAPRRRSTPTERPLPVTVRTFTVEDPATLEVIAEVPDQDAEGAHRAVDRAAAAFPEWSRTAPRHRADVLRRAHELMLRDRDSLAELISRENGKSLADAAGEVTYAAEFFRWFSEETVRLGGEYGEAPTGGVRTMVQYRPVGVAALVTPWIFPAAMATRKIAPALAAGCTTVLKPAAETPMTALAIAKLLLEAGLPHGCVELVTTTDPGSVVSTWLEASRVRKLSFTGSTGVGRQLLRQAADRVLNASMELGGNAPLIVTEDADLDAAVAGAITAKFRNGGQACTAANRLYVHSDVAFDFTACFGAEVEGLSVGAAVDGAAIGPLISAAARDRVAATVDTARADGARISHQSELPDLQGHFYPATVLADVGPGAAVLRDEIFGPVAPIVVWHDERELLDQVNHTEYGLAAYVFAGELRRAIRLAEQIDAGMVGINHGLVSDPSAPFGGVKQSGLGREGARDGLRQLQEIQYLSVDWNN